MQIEDCRMQIETRMPVILFQSEICILQSAIQSACRIRPVFA